MSVAQECGMLKKDEVCMEVSASRDVDGGCSPVVKFVNHLSHLDDVNITKVRNWVSLQAIGLIACAD